METPWFPLNIPKDAWRVQDADEEVFLLYSRLQSPCETDNAHGEMTGLGFVDSRQGEIDVHVDVRPVQETPPISVPDSTSSPSRASRRSKTTSKHRPPRKEECESLDIHLFQDMSSLRSRKGDTGSVLWRASVYLARLLLSQQQSSSALSLLLKDRLETCHVLELGSGTGLLSIALAPYVAHYTATDLPSLLPLIRKNQTHNLSKLDLAKVTVDDLDWVQLHNTPPLLRHKLFSTPTPVTNASNQRVEHRMAGKRVASPTQESATGLRRPIDLIFAVDCIYNPSLIAPLLSTIDYLSTLGSHIPFPSDTLITSDSRAVTHPAVLVVLELRAADVTRDFIDGWLMLPGNWEIWNVHVLSARFVMWAGRRTVD